jgi:hypothetical protein
MPASYGGSRESPVPVPNISGEPEVNPKPQTLNPKPKPFRGTSLIRNCAPP